MITVTISGAQGSGKSRLAELLADTIRLDGKTVYIYEDGDPIVRPLYASSLPDIAIVTTNKVTA